MGSLSLLSWVRTHYSLDTLSSMCQCPVKCFWPIDGNNFLHWIVENATSLPDADLIHMYIYTMGVLPQKNSLNLVWNIKILEYSDSNPFVWSQSINLRKASFSGIAPVETHNKRFIITISGGGYFIRSRISRHGWSWILLGTMHAIDLFVCEIYENKSDFLISHKINRLNRFFCGNTPNDN